MLCLEVFIEVKVSAIFILALHFFACALLLVCTSHDTSLLVVADTLLEEVRLASERDGLHKVEGVARIVVLQVAKRNKETIRTELDVLLHKRGVHT